MKSSTARQAIALLSITFISTLAIIFPAHAQDKINNKIEAYGDIFSRPQFATKTQARIYAYRTQLIKNSQPINIYINSRYHASLLAGGYTEFCLYPGKINMQLALDDARQMHLGKEVVGQVLSAQAGQVQYIRIEETTGDSASFQVIPEQQALAEIRRTARQKHTVSRAPEAQECSNDLVGPPEPPKALIPPPREYAIETDALFEFGNPELRAEGFNSIEALIQKVRSDYTQIERIRVIGYTDAIGTVALNKKLSQQRADAVAKRLLMRGLQPTRGIQAEGRWSLELAKTSCNNSPTPANKACHAPNRRVVIVVSGLRR